jgi:hypothetical protein
MVIGEYFISDYINYYISGYLKLNYHMLLMVICDYSINGYWWLFYSCLLRIIPLMNIVDYFINAYY